MDEKHFKDAAPDVRATNVELAYDPVSRAYWFDMDGRRWWIRCKMQDHRESEPGVTTELMARFALAVRNGHIKTLPIPLEVKGDAGSTQTPS
jgi:hypothetical protein